MKHNRGTFRRGYNQLIRCRCCNRQTQSQIGADLCQLCFDSASVQNEHFDDGPEHSFSPHSQCPECQHVACLHELRK